MQVVLSAALSRLLPLQLGSYRTLSVQGRQMRYGQGHTKMLVWPDQTNISIRKKF